MTHSTKTSFDEELTVDDEVLIILNEIAVK